MMQKESYCKNDSVLLSNLINKHKIGIARSFDRAALKYDQYAKFQRICGMRLCKLIGKVKKRQILDAGCGTGWFSRYWKKQGNYIIALDLSKAMLAYAKKNHSASIYILGDIEQLPIANNSIDIIFSNLAIQWCNNLSNTLVGLYRVLKPGGILALSTLAKGSLIELEQAWKKIDDEIHVNNFLTDSMITTAFAPYNHDIIIEIEHLYYKNIIDLLKEIKGVGANYLYNKRFHGFTTPNVFIALKHYWPRKSIDFFSLSYRVVYVVLYRD